MDVPGDEGVFGALGGHKRTPRWSGEEFMSSQASGVLG
jgi:hypothetical protein